MPPLRFRKVKISDERYEAAGVFDVNNDGRLDIVCGAWWYPGPDFARRCPVGPVRAEGEYFDDFSTIPIDVNGDGFLDFVTGGWWGGNLRWRENPKGDPAKEWAEHEIGKCGNVETTRAWDLDGDGRLEIVPNTPNHPQKAYKLVLDSAGRGKGAFREFVLYDGKLGHGLGFGDIDGDGRGELVCRHGWLKPPPGNPLSGPWELVRAFDLGSASVPIIVADVNGDGVNDLIVGQAHGYGLDWWEQRRNGGRSEWVKHPIDPFNSQYHDMWWGDLDGDGKPELVTGKRYRAHCGRDPGEYDPYGLYYFKWTGEGFAKQIVDYGPNDAAKGCGIFFQVADLRGTGRLDIVAPGKDGLCVFFNEGTA